MRPALRQKRPTAYPTRTARKCASGQSPTPLCICLYTLMSHIAYQTRIARDCVSGHSSTPSCICMYLLTSHMAYIGTASECASGQSPTALCRHTLTPVTCQHTGAKALVMSGCTDMSCYTCWVHRQGCLHPLVCTAPCMYSSQQK